MSSPSYISNSQRQLMTEFVTYLDKFFEQLGIDEKTRKELAHETLKCCVNKNSQVMHRAMHQIIMNLKDKKNNALIHFFSKIAELSKNHRLKTDYSLVLTFMLLSQKDIKERFKDDKEFINKMKLQLKELKEELKEIDPQKANELDKLFEEVNQSLDKMEKNLQNNKALDDNTPTPNNFFEEIKRMTIDAMRGYASKGGYAPQMSGLTDAIGFTDDSELGVEKDMEGLLDQLADAFAKIFKQLTSDSERLDHPGDVPDTPMESAYQSKFGVPKGAPDFKPPGSTTKT